MDKKNYEANSIRDATFTVEGKADAMIGAIIGHLRRAEGVSQIGLAQKLGVSRDLISDFELGKEGVSLTLLEKIAQALNFESRAFIESVDAYRRFSR